MEEIQTQKSFRYLQEVEKLAQDIITAKETRIRLSNLQNKHREALRALQHVEDRNTWMQVAGFYVLQPTNEAKAQLQEEMALMDEDLKALSLEVKSKVHELRDVEHQPRLEGFGLKPMSLNEAKVMNRSLGFS